MNLKKLEHRFIAEFNDLDEFLETNKCIKEYNRNLKKGMCEGDILDIILDKYYNTKSKFYLLLPQKDLEGYDLYLIFEKKEVLKWIKKR